MAFIPTTNTLSCELRFLLDEQKIENTLYFRYASVPTAANAAALGAALKTWWSGTMNSVLSNQISLNEIYFVSQESSTAPTYSYTAGLPIAGDLTAAPVPNNCALTVSFRTAGRGRSARGRNYVAGIQAGALVSNSFTQSTVDIVVAAYNSLIGVAADNGCTWVVVSKYTANAPRIAGLAQTVTNAVAVDLIVDSQRRRLPGRGT